MSRPSSIVPPLDAGRPEAASPSVLSTRLLVAELMLIVALAVAIFSGWRPPVVVSLSWSRVMHVGGAILALGNFVAGAFLLAFTGRTGRKSVYAFVSHALQWSEVVLSAPGVLLLLYGGGVLATPLGGPTTTPWLRTSTFLALSAGLLWIGLLVPLQHRLIVLSRDEKDAERWERLAKRYSIPGTLAGLLTIAALVLMVLRPASL